MAGCKGGKKKSMKRKGGSMLGEAALPALLTGLVLNSRKSRTRKARRGKPSKTRRVRRA